MTISINLILFVIIGAIRYRDSPLSPSQILWMNLIMDTFAACILATEIPYERDLTYKDENFSTILDQTQPYGFKRYNLYSKPMFINIICATIYQQIVIFIIFYKGSLIWGNESSNWSLQQLYENG